MKHPALVLLVSAAVLFGAYKLDIHRRTLRAHWATHRIEIAKQPGLFDDKVRHGHCSATAIGPHALLTAAHCESDFPDIRVDGMVAHVDKYIYDTADHEILLMSGITFPVFVHLADRPLEQGDEVLIWGNPAKHRDYLRRGYVVAINNEPDYGTEAVLDLNGFFGDSGSAVFDEWGNVMSVTSMMEVDERDGNDAQLKMMFAFDMSFRQSDLETARKY